MDSIHGLDGRTRDRLERRLAKSLERHQLKAGEQIERHVRLVLEAWQRRFPKRSVRFIDAMGSVCVWIDDRQAELEISIRDPRLARVVRPLVELQSWYCQVSDLHHVAIEDVVIPARSSS